MKRLIALLIAFSLVFSFAGCEVINELLGESVTSDTDTPSDEYGDVTAPDGDGDKAPDGSGDSTNPDGSGAGTSPDKPDDNGNGSNTEPDDNGSGSNNPDCEDDKHTDTDNDGFCDDCSVSVIVIVDIFSINDIHGKISANSTQPGIGGLTTYLERESDGNAVYLSAGDMWQGTAESGLNHGAFMTDWMSEVGFAAMTLGNHEYDWGESYIKSNSAIAEFPFLGINVYDTSTGKRAEYASPSVVVSIDGIEIGIIGAMGDCYSSISGDVKGGFTFKTGSELTSLVKAEANRLRAAGVDFIIYSVHDGYGSNYSGIKNVSASDISSYYDSSLSNGYVDLVFEGHTHRSYILRDSYGVYHLQGGGENSGLSRVEISINSANGNTGVGTPTVVKSSSWSSLPTAPTVTELISKYSDDITRANEVLGTNSRTRSDSEVEQLVADMYYEFGLKRWGDRYDIILGGGFIRTRSPYSLKSGTVRYSDIYSLLTFDNQLVLCSIKGSDLYKKFVNTTNSDYYISSGMSADELKTTLQNNPNKTYYIVTDTYTSSYTYNGCTEVARYDSEVYARDLVADYIKKGRLV